MHTVDTFSDPYIPRSQVHRLPKPLNRFLGYRSPDATTAPLNEILNHLSVLLSTFAGLVVVMSVNKYANTFIHRGVPEIVPSWGATAILIYNAMGAPLAQPRNVIFGTFISSLIGVCLMRLWLTSAGNEDTLWLAGALSTAISSVVMTLTNTLHPPAGAAALLPSVDDEVRALSWYYLPVQLVSSVLMVGVACLMNNILLRYPAYWWTPYKKPVPEVEKEESKV